MVQCMREFQPGSTSSLLSMVVPQKDRVNTVPGVASSRYPEFSTVAASIYVSYLRR
jgi:hypothetical protein